MSGPIVCVTGVGTLFPPVDRRLWRPDTGPSVGYLKQVSASNLAGSFEKGSRLLRELAGIVLGPRGVHRVSQKVGKALWTQREQSRERFLQGKPLAAPPNPPELLVISADGGRVQTRDKDPGARWKENKVGVLYRAVSRPEPPGNDYEGPRPLVRTYTATMNDWESMGDYLSQEAAQRGYDQARQKVFIGDGAQAIKSLWQRCFVDATFILDWTHAVEHLHACAVAAFGNTDQAHDWYEHQKESLWHGKTHLVLRAIAKQSKRLGKPRKNSSEQDPRLVLARNHTYFRENESHMNYSHYRANGWPIGSGIVESTIKQLGKQVKGTEKHWSLTGVEAILLLMISLLAEDSRWDSFWKSHPFSSFSSRAA